MIAAMPSSLTHVSPTTTTRIGSLPARVFLGDFMSGAEPDKLAWALQVLIAFSTKILVGHRLTRLVAPSCAAGQGEVPERESQVGAVGSAERHHMNLRMSNRRFTRLTNAVSKKLENLEHSVALYAMHYNFCRIHRTLRVTPAMEAGITRSRLESRRGDCAFRLKTDA